MDMGASQSKVNNKLVSISAHDINQSSVLCLQSSFGVQRCIAVYMKSVVLRVQPGTGNPPVKVFLKVPVAGIGIREIGIAGCG